MVDEIEYSFRLKSGCIMDPAPRPPPATHTLDTDHQPTPGTGKTGLGQWTTSPGFWGNFSALQALVSAKAHLFWIPSSRRFLTFHTMPFITNASVGKNSSIPHLLMIYSWWISALSLKNGVDNYLMTWLAES